MSGNNADQRRIEMKRLAIVGTVLASALLATGTPALASTSHGTSVKPWCKASAAPANDGWPGDYNVYVKSNRPHRSATASDATDKWSHETNRSGAATIYLWYQSPGERIKVTVGGATCWTKA
jgi:hypothetical protein